jgi:acyl-CoA thioester hydrolase
MQRTYVYHRKINYYETDKMGVVHHSNYIRFMEEARIAFLEVNDMSYAEFEERGLISPVTAVECAYKFPAVFGDEIDVLVEFKQYTGVKYVYAYTMTNSKTGAVVAIGQTEHCLTNKEGRPIIVKKQFPDLHEIFSKMMEE